MQDIFSFSDYWWRYFIYGALFHFVAVTPLAKTARHADLFRFSGYAVAAIPVLLREGILAGVFMIGFLYAFAFALQYFKGFFK